MATTNVSVTDAWTLVAGTAVDPFLLSFTDGVEIAVTAANGTTPTVGRGHWIDRSLGTTREQLGAGAVWARAGTAGKTAIAVLT
jgi:hypothetical protein